MGRRLQYIGYVTVLAGCVILCNQFFYLYNLHKREKNTYIYQQNEFIESAIYEFSLKSTNYRKTNNKCSYDANTNELIYYVDKNLVIYKLDIKENIQQINIRSAYDIRDSELWTLKKFHSYLQKKIRCANNKKTKHPILCSRQHRKCKRCLPEEKKSSLLVRV